uniref:Ribonuclease Y n=1 Tax=Talaromyces marneffei PM1 TaxID=1077442 RepID=A0A093V846_TALMA
MPVYKIHGFPWPRGGIPSIRVFIVLENIDDASAEYIQNKRTSNLILNAIKKNHPAAEKHLPNLQLIEQYDPLDMTDAATPLDRSAV